MHPGKRKRSAWPGIVMAGAGATAFSGKAIIVKLAYRYDVDAVTLIMYRMLFAMPLFVALAWWSGRGRPAVSRRDMWIVTGLGFGGYYLSSFLDFAGLQYVGAGLERLILYLNPTIVLVVGIVLFKTAVNRRQWLALAFSYLGVMVVFGHEVTLAGSHVALGASLVFAGAICYALYLVIGGQLVQRFGALRLTGLATSIACVFCIGQFLVLRPISAMQVAPEVLWLSLLNATLCTFCPVVLVMMAVERIGPGMTAQLGMVGPLSTILLSALLLDEPITLWVLAGTSLVLCGIWMLTRANRRLAKE